MQLAGASATRKRGPRATFEGKGYALPSAVMAEPRRGGEAPPSYLCIGGHVAPWAGRDGQSESCPPNWPFNGHSSPPPTVPGPSPPCSGERAMHAPSWPHRQACPLLAWLLKLPFVVDRGIVGFGKLPIVIGEREREWRRGESEARAKLSGENPMREE